MNDYLKHNLLITFISILLLVGLTMLPFSIYGQDGYSLWFPILSEYLKGDSHYHSSEVIFGGQNLAGVYGNFPFWKVLRAFNPRIEVFINLTHGIFVILLTLLILNLVKGIRGKNNNYFDIALIFTYAFLSPVVTNRVLAGHFNLLFGILPFFAFASLIFNKSILNIIFCTFCVWCAMSTQAFQILSYHLFYVPLLIGLIMTFEKDKKKYMLVSLAVFLSAFILNFSNFLEMYHHATNSNNLRSIHTNMVYTYIISTGRDLTQFLLSGQYADVLGRGLGYYHEVSYPVGAFLLFFFYRWSNNKIPMLILGTAVVCYLFCMNITPFNYLSELPLIKPFRVPQRVFMVLSFFVPVWFYAQIKFEVKKKDYLLFSSLILLSQFIDYYEFLAFAFVLVTLFVPKYQSLKWAALVAFSGLFTGSLAKVTASKYEQQRYLVVKKLLLPMTKHFSTEELRKTRFHFDTQEQPLVNYVAQSMGISTIEGYGHPPSLLIKKVESLLNVVFPVSVNNLYVGGNYQNRDHVLRELGVKKIVRFDTNNELIITNL